MAIRIEKSGSNTDSPATEAGSMAGMLYDEIRAEGLIGSLKKTVETHLTGGKTDTNSDDLRDPDFFNNADKSGLSADREVRMDGNGDIVSEDVKNGMTGDPGLKDETRGPDFFDDADLSNYDADRVTFEDGSSFDNTGLNTEIDESYLDMSSKIIELEYLSENIDDISSDYMSEGKLAGMASIALADGTSSIWKDRWDNIMAYDVDKGKAVKVADKESKMAENYDKVQEKVTRVRDRETEYGSMKDEMIEDTMEDLSIDSSSQDPVSSINTAFHNSGLGEKLYDSLEANTQDWLENYST